MKVLRLILSSVFLRRRSLVGIIPVGPLCGLVGVLGSGSQLLRAAESAWVEGQTLSLEVRPAEGERFKLGKFDCWVPSGSMPLAAVIIHQHGCGANAGTSSVPMVRDMQWQALARARHCALLVPRYDDATCANWNDPANGSDRALDSALRDFAARSHHPEMVTAPWLLWGHSGGASWSVQMVLRHPGRTLALALRGGAAGQLGDADFRKRFVAASEELPMIFISGESERSPASTHHVSWEPFQAMTRELRAPGRSVAWMIDPRTEHHCGDSRLVVIPYFDAVLVARAAGGKLPAVVVDESSLAISEIDSEKSLPTHGFWLPSRSVAEKWVEFQHTGTVTHVGPMKQAPELRGVVTTAGRVTLTWRLHPEIDSGVRAVRIYRNGALLREMGAGPAEFIAGAGDTPPAELQTSEYIDRSAQPGLGYDYAVTFINCAGIESPRSPIVHLAVPFPRGSASP